MLIEKVNQSKNFIIKKGLNNLKIGLVRFTGRNIFGRITVFSKGKGLNNYNYRILTYKYLNIGCGLVLKKELDRRRSSFIGLIFYKNGFIKYSLLPDQLNIYNILNGYTITKESNNFTIGSYGQLQNFPIGSYIFNVEILENQGGKFARAAGTWTQLISKHSDKIVLKLKSGAKQVVSSKLLGSLGFVSRIDWKSYKFKNAGERRRLGFKSKVRGVAMNPCDHPHGGGEGKKSKSVAPRTPWGKFTIKTKTRNKLKVLKKKKLMKKIEYYL